MDGFNVSHTKDEILFSQDDEEVLDKRLLETLLDFKKAAEEYRKLKKEEDEEGEESQTDFKSIVSYLFQAMQQPSFSGAVADKDILPQAVIEATNEEYYERIESSEIRDTYSAQIGSVKVTVIINDESSIYEPYLVIRFRASEHEVGIVINRNHPHWKTMENVETIFNFIKHCIYDGISEWKANWLVGNLEPETIKMIKDRLMRQELIIV